MEALAAVLQTVTSSPLLPFLLLGPLLVAILWWRTGSIYSLLDRLWLLTVGKGDVQDAAIRSMLQQGRDLERLKYSLGVKRIDTVPQAHRLDAWMKENDIGFAELRLIRNWVSGRSSELLIQPPKLASCRAGQSVVMHATGFTASESEAVCKGLEDGELRAVTRQGRQDQMWVGLCGVLVSIFLAYQCFMGAAAVLDVNRLRRRLSSPPQ